MRKIALLVAANLMLSATSALAGAEAASPAHYSTSTTQMNVLLANPDTKAVLQKYIPQLLANPDMAERASGMTLQEIQGALKAYAPDLLSDKVLGQIDADLATVPVKN